MFIIEYNTANDDIHGNRLQNSAAKLALLQLEQSNTTNLETIDQRTEKLMGIRKHDLSDPSQAMSICDYLSVKGLPSSGTNWLKYLLITIKDKICEKAVDADASALRNHS